VAYVRGNSVPFVREIKQNKADAMIAHRRCEAVLGQALCLPLRFFEKFPAMEEIAGILCGLLVVLTIVMVVGHGMWMVLAALFRWLAGEPSDPLKPRPDKWRDDLQASYRQLESLRSHELMGADDLRVLHERLRAFERKMLAQESRAALGLRPESPAASERAPAASEPADPFCGTAGSARRASLPSCPSRTST
jgi:hypothetical protein